MRRLECRSTDPSCGCGRGLVPRVARSGRAATRRRLFRAEELAAQNELALVPLAETTGPAALELFVTRARSYRERLPAAWDLPYGYPRGTVTAGLHAAISATEWHLHAWDLARSGGSAHGPSDPDALYRGAGACLATAQGGLKGRIAAVLVPLGARLSPWEALLRRSGRAPGPED